MGRAIVLLHRETDGRPPPPAYTTTSTGVLFPFAGELNPRIRDGKGRVRGRTPAALWCSRASESRYSTSSGALNGGGTAAPEMGGTGFEDGGAFADSGIDDFGGLLLPPEEVPGETTTGGTTTGGTTMGG